MTNNGWIKFRPEWVAVAKRLSDKEFRRFIEGIMEYSAGEAPRFDGREAFVFDLIQEQLDKVLADRDAAARKHRESGKSGGRPKKETENQNGFENCEKNQNGFENSEKNQNKPKITKSNILLSYISNTSTSSQENTQEDTEDKDMPFGITEAEIQDSMEKETEIEHAAREYGLPASVGALRRAQELADEYGHDKLIDAVKKAGLGRCQSWAYVEGILRNEKAGSKGEKKAWYEPTGDAPEGMVVL